MAVTAVQAEPNAPGYPEPLVTYRRRQAGRGRSVTWFMIGGVLLTITLAWYGVYILEHYAK